MEDTKYRVDHYPSVREGARHELWMHDLCIHGQGASLEEARRDLVREVIHYAAAFYEEGLSKAPNHAGNASRVDLIQQVVYELIFGD